MYQPKSLFDQARKVVNCNVTGYKAIQDLELPSELKPVLENFYCWDRHRGEYDKPINLIALINKIKFDRFDEEIDVISWTALMDWKEDMGMPPFVYETNLVLTRYYSVKVHGRNWHQRMCYKCVTYHYPDITIDPGVKLDYVFSHSCEIMHEYIQNESHYCQECDVTPLFIVLNASEFKRMKDIEILFRKYDGVDSDDYSTGDCGADSSD